MLVSLIPDEYGWLEEIFYIYIDDKDIYDDREISLCVREQI